MTTSGHPAGVFGEVTKVTPESLFRIALHKPRADMNKFQAVENVSLFQILLLSAFVQAEL